MIAPLLAKVDATSDPVDGALYLAAAELTEQLHRSSPLVRAAEGDFRRGCGHIGDPPDPAEIRQRRELIAQLVAVRKSLRESGNRAS